MLKIKYHPGGMSLNGPAFECFAARMVLAGHEVLIVASTPGACSGIAEALESLAESPASAPTHVLIGQVPWYMNETKDNTLEDVLPPVKAVTRRPTSLGPQKGFFS